MSLPLSQAEVGRRGYSATQPPPFTEADLAQAVETFQRDGYFIARGLFSPEEVEDLNGHFAKMHAEGVPGFYEPGKLVKADGKIASGTSDPLAKWPRVMHPHRFDEKARAYMIHPKIRVYLEAFMGRAPVATQSMYYFKPPGARGQAIHQDNFYLLVQPGTCMAAWTALDDCDAGNGGLMVVPNTQDADLACPDMADLKLSFSPAYVPVPKGKRPEYADMKAGDTLFFNGNVLHGSGPNRSKTRFRRSWICHYAKGDLAKISKYYVPVVSMDGRDIIVESETSGGPCGGLWEGAPGA